MEYATYLWKNLMSCLVSVLTNKYRRRNMKYQKEKGNIYELRNYSIETLIKTKINWVSCMKDIKEGVND